MAANTADESREQTGEYVQIPDLSWSRELTVSVNTSVTEILTGISDAEPIARVGPRAALV